MGEYDFHLSQLQYTKSAMNQLPTFVPMAMTGTQMQSEYDALHATSFDVLHKGPGETEFTIVADDTIDKVFDASGPVSGNHEYKVIGQNSRGNGPESEVATVVVA